jgi:hypothetical protein
MKAASLASLASQSAAAQQQQQQIQARLQGCWLAEAHRCRQLQLQLLVLVLLVVAPLVAVLQLLVLVAGQAAPPRSSHSRSPSLTGLTPCQRRKNMQNTTSSSTSSNRSSNCNSLKSCRSPSMTPGAMASLLLLPSHPSPLLMQQGAKSTGRQQQGQQQQQQQQRTQGKVHIGCLWACVMATSAMQLHGQQQQGQQPQQQRGLEVLAGCLQLLGALLAVAEAGARQSR